MPAVAEPLANAAMINRLEVAATKANAGTDEMVNACNLLQPLTTATCVNRCAC